uniref:Uncharacterized protein n=1 Tax=Strombidium rassoulzadegani TaxID=1082188 RepID=A0A7S3CSG9_9SPIT|mmetsp:Transcript_6341/g.10759  ORF Transcript_6341/g.10759 Transcript_6341/m.10759 type:complete len:131 (+) Transcript_6341:1135-1527(+)
MIRGGHLDMTVLGSLEVSRDGDIANWIIPNKKVKGMGGAMDLVQGVKKVVVVMEHVTKSGKIRILEKCNLPVTGRNVIDMLITDMAVFSFEKQPGGKFVLEEIAEGYTLEDIRANTGCEFEVSPDLKTFN